MANRLRVPPLPTRATGDPSQALRLVLVRRYDDRFDANGTRLTRNEHDECVCRVIEWREGGEIENQIAFTRVMDRADVARLNAHVVVAPDRGQVADRTRHRRSRHSSRAMFGDTGAGVARSAQARDVALSTLGRLRSCIDAIDVDYPNALVVEAADAIWSITHGGITLAFAGVLI